jgi:hypothetical protein
LKEEEVNFWAWNLVNLLLIALVFLYLRSKGMCLDLRILTSLEVVVFFPSSPFETVTFFLKLEITVFLLEMLIRVKILAMLLLKAYLIIIIYLILYKNYNLHKNYQIIYFNFR